MEWTGLNDLREKFLKFYESKGHVILQSAPLVPKDDASLLLINSGMAPLKKYFLGVETPPARRATSCQKCIRTPDIERVGKTARHGTYFEMLGNFSFGDYFKHEATKWAWEFITQELKLPVDRIWVSVYEDDDETVDIWVNEVGVDPSHIVRLGKEDNFWEIGSGPCGPCSELYFDRGEEYGCGKPTCGVGCDCDRYVEFWNLVFSQFDSDGEGHYTPMEHPNIDTGMGLERIACIMQGVNNLFEVDTVQRIMKHIAGIAGVEYGQDEKTDVSLRVITDHIRSTTFMIGDGVVPTNEGRGYVLRRLLRRAARHGRLLGIHEPFLYKVCETVIAENEKAYPELRENQDYIVKVIHNEEERFAKTIDQGMELLGDLIDRIEAESLSEEEKILSGEQAFKLYDTFGFPIDLTREILEERHIGLNEEEFTRYMNEQKERARAARAAMGDVSWEEDILAPFKDNKTEFVGYTESESDAKILAMVMDGQLVDSISEGDSATILLNRTPFYAESGGQVGDMGLILGGKCVFKVMDCKKSASGLYMHIGVMASGMFTTGDEVHASVSMARRRAIMRNHTAAHLLQEALREVLGNHVHQAGSYVDEAVCRFDFSHFSAMTPEELDRVEYLVNDMILSSMDVKVAEMSIEEAKATGAMALFGEKYGSVVRVVNMGGRSIELCGGTHVANTGNVGLFKIVKESSVAAGVRRIEAVTGRGVLRLIDTANATLLEASSNLKLSNPAELVAKTAAITAELKAKDKEIERLTQKLADVQVDGLFGSAQEIGGVKFAMAGFTGTKPDALKTMADRIKEQAPNMVALLYTVVGEKASIVAVCGKEAQGKGLHAGKLIKEFTALVGGSGGGRPDVAMGGASEILKLDEAAAKVPQIIEKMVKTK
ncbi:alanine--tRNA ligase [Phocea massiliensis]|uniref:Alanine--tRNA ligase n=1 Tax=uncultured Anaerotruncus sp. TaxID=905011 RepID=A0A6N2SRP3_9FIRM|nr:alanine--tRNA ligase [Merdimmobilis hominis]MCD4836120.1 alanine--tRNA ligase [Merdimmobilis hominis]